MDFQWVALAMGDVAWISLAFALGFLARQAGLPPLVGFLTAGFILNAMGATSGEALNKLADLGVTLLLFTIGLKLDLRTLARPQVWAVTLLHMGLTTAVFGLVFIALAATGVAFFAGMEPATAVLIGFALSFSSTVFVVKVLEQQGEMSSLHGRISIGILIMQDLAAVVFLTASTGKLPSLWAASLLLLIPLRPLLTKLLERTGHGELLVLFGLFLAMGGAEVFELVGMKADLGALALGVLIAGHTKASELAREMLGFKDLFLVGFFLSIGLSGHPSVGDLLLGLLLALVIPFKTLLFLAFLNRFRLRSRTSLLTSLNLTNYSEFGLIVAAIGVANGWLPNQWLIVIAIALSLTFVLASPLNAQAHNIYSKHREFWKRLQRAERLPDDAPLDTGDASIAVFGMGRVGASAYDRMRDAYGDTVVGVDYDAATVQEHRAAGRRVVQGEPTDADFWDRLQAEHRIGLVMLAMPNLRSNQYVTNQLRRTGFRGYIAATAKYPDEVEILTAAGADAVFNIYAEAGSGFAAQVEAGFKP